MSPQEIPRAIRLPVMRTWETLRDWGRQVRIEWKIRQIERRSRAKAKMEKKS